MSTKLDQLSSWLKERKITEVECLISDLTGIARGKISPTNKFLDEKGMRLPESVLLQTVTGDYVEDDIYYDLLDEADIDMFCRPDENAVFLVPWAIEPTAMVIHDTFDKQGNPIELSPRNILKNVLKLYADKGWKPIVAPEMEFYLTKRNSDPDFPLVAPMGRSGRPEVGRQSFSIDAANEFDPLFEDVYDWCEIQGLDLDTLIHEDGPAQMEINFRHGEALHLADQITVFKRTMREAALKHDVAATFMAKPITDQPGSAMHIHQSVVDIKTGKNLFSNPDGSMSELFMLHIGGLQKYIPELLPLFAPNVNSFRRFLPDTSAPVNVEWGEENRTVGLRVPEATPQNRRVENRLAGADANPYLVLAASLLCGYMGMVGDFKPSAPVKGRAYERRNLRLPITIEHALERMEACKDAEKFLGEKFMRGYVAVKRAEHENYKRVISSWEREFLLLSV
ncbi:L-glutamine synthetase [Pseudomonas peli]|jgi:glutamine synthetase|uniref:L-glutamine synthetase n=1 Tax=Pseudomonas peli TaxID=592361 RepID=A0AB37ZAJ3_9PSED|nr:MULTISPECIES: glutamine synthetase family protein [Pseudomonas]OHC21059.1 MAG: glutamine synthetase [Pseudomonadales bacterium RIFCSPHIGHO2_02_FULL_60_43]MDR7025579.1 glutamine synthetase [Pseudomonas peli]NMY52418.1 glutamine synthetase [Pseudomonas sp. WS 5011]NMZ67606.1 glutamine synthetase [Pseudomonas peli]PJE44654.1 MAG: glutamine synthetase [Pseudomonas sp.] [Pseudomonas sp. FEMGT703P]|tara:strand:- start:15428 stop:16786 length:1359 start_codon:yes stop_codon:yes gene_type:complete